MPDSLSLVVGDRVIYPNQGLCVVTEIKNEQIAGTELTFVSLVFEETGAKVKVPKDKLAKNGVRLVSNETDVKDVISYLKSDSEKASLDWKKRSRENTEKLAVGGMIGLAEVVKGLQVLSELRPLPPKEREQYDDARKLFVSELAVAAKVSLADAEDMLDIVLFPVGKERPKRTAEEFKGLDGEDELGLGSDLLGLDDAAESEPEEAPGEEESEASGDDEDETEKPAKTKTTKIGSDTAKAKPGKKPSLLSDTEVTATQSEALALPKKRGRPGKAKAEGDDSAAAPKKKTKAVKK